MSLYIKKKMKKLKWYDKSLYGNNWKDLSKQCKKRDNFICKKCGYNQKLNSEFRYLHADHIMPLSRGGINNLSNLQTLCENCHQKKTNAGRLIKNKVHWIENKKKQIKIKNKITKLKRKRML